MQHRAKDILEIHGNSILRLAYSYTHNMEDSEDILQETLIKYIQSEPSIEDEKKEKAWLLRVASNLSKNKIRYNNYRRHEDIADYEIPDSDNKDKDLDFVWEAVACLPSHLSETVHLYYQENYSTKEISKILDRNESTVRSDLRKSRLRLKNLLKEDYDFEI